MVSEEKRHEPIGRGRGSVPAAAAAQTPDAWWKIHVFRGMINDVRRRAPFYVSDWLDAWDYRVVPATVYMYFAKQVLTFSFSFVSDVTKTNTLQILAVFFPRWPFLWTCSRRRVRITVSMRFSWLPFWGRLFSPCLPLNHLLLLALPVSVIHGQWQEVLSS